MDLAAWLLGYLRYTCGVLGYLATCLPSMRVNEHEEAGEANNDVHHQGSVDGSNIDDSLDNGHNLEPKHKIFLSHSGAQKEFVEQLCVDIERCDRYPFFDKWRSSLPIGERFPKLIFDAIDQCQIGVVVLSKEFFTSKWPMLELNAMVKLFIKPNSRITIFPVFYLISVEALKDPENHKQWILQWKKWALKDKRINVEEWKKAIRVLGSINSLVIKGYMGDVKFREEIVTEICHLVPPATRWDDNHVQGRLRSCKVIREKMDQVCTFSRVGLIGLYGVGGIGKTTICKALCNDLSQTFCDNVCHIELGSRSEMELLRKALKKLTKMRDDIVDKLDDLEEGHAYLKKNICTKPIFFALDNVQDDYKSIDGALTYLKAFDGFGSGSIVLVTARSLHVLKQLHLEENQCMEMPELEEDEARTLFLNHTNMPIQNEISEGLIRDCTKRCHFLKSNGSCRHYHPLALKVLGQQLGPKSSTWEVQLRKIDTINQLGDTNHPIFSILRNSFDLLKYVENFDLQLVVMDVALFSSYVGWEDSLERYTVLEWLCIMHGVTTEVMITVLEILQSKSMLEDVNGGFTKIGMHDLSREFAVAETKVKDFRDRRWVYQADGKRAVRRSGACWEKVERMFFLNEGWRGLEGVKLDDFVNVTAFKLKVNSLLEKGALDLDFSGLNHLKSLDLYTPNLTIRATGLSSLKHLAFMSWCTLGFPPCIDEVGRLTNLQVLELIYGEGAQVLDVKVPKCEGIQVLDVTELKLLRVVRIANSPDLITVRGFSSSLVTLRSLYITCCTSLRECPGLDELHALEVLCLYKCGKLEELPCLGRLTKLRALYIPECKSIRALSGLNDLASLEEFNAYCCWELAVLPDLVKLTKLRILDLLWCPLQKVPDLDGLTSMTTLRVSFAKISGEPPAPSKLSELNVELVDGWNRGIWATVRSLLMLEELKLYYCEGEDVPDFQNLKRLKLVLFWSCEFKDLSGLSNSTALESLTVEGCQMLERLPTFERLTKLTYLRLQRCRNLREWPSESTLCSLKELSVDSFSLMEIGLDLGMLTNLRELWLWESERPALASGRCETMLSMASLSHLEGLKIFFFPTMEAFDLSDFTQLRELYIDGCDALGRLTCSGPLTALTQLSVINCKSLEELPDFGMFPLLEKLFLKKCEVLRRLTCSVSLTALKRADLNDCKLELPDLSLFPKLSF